MLNKKLKKLKKNPKLFFKDMISNLDKKVSKFRPVKINGYSQYTVVSAVYNVNKYLDQYFSSLVSQNLDFKKHIHLILVDDGSTDNSAEIIKKWKKRFPENITYIYKENGGQGSARNLGLDYVKTPWVTFIDPDDFVDLDYFLKIDGFIEKHRDIDLICANFIFYFEDRNKYQDSHPLNFRFKGGEKILLASDMKKHMQLAVNCAIFNTEKIEEIKLRFNESIRPNFEDAHYVNKYLAVIFDKKVGFIPSAKYYYRKRSDNSSTLDTSWNKIGLYSDVLQMGCLDVFNYYIETIGFVPTHIQRTVLYHLAWYFKRLTDNEHLVSFLSENDIQNFHRLMNSIFKNIDEDVINDFELVGFWFYQKFGILNLYKQKEPEFQIIYIDDFDRNKNLICLKYFHSVENDLVSLEKNKELIFPVNKKSIEHTFFGKTFSYETYLWFELDLNEIDHFISSSIDDKEYRFSLQGKHHKGKISINEIKKRFEPKIKINQLSKYSNCWVFMDRDSSADDNAEHLYRYISNLGTRHNIYFVLRKTSSDWSRLENEGFKLIEFGSKEHEKALRQCNKIISSHADLYVVDYFGDKSLLEKDFIFLQHGITKDDMSSWFNSKRLALLITASTNEYLSIIENGSNYKFSNKQTILSGFPRHDELIKKNKLAKNQKSKHVILIMPTWRANLVGKKTGIGNDRHLIENFTETQYCKSWQAILNSEYIKDLNKSKEYEIIFYPHLNIQPYLNQMTIDSHITIASLDTVANIQDLFIKADIMITDYSSVAFDFALLKKPIIYYQFDKVDVFNSGHIYSKGYFEYENDGFGPVCFDDKSIIKSLKHIIYSDFKIDDIYLNRILNSLPFDDELCCKRVYEKICELDNPISNNDYDVNLITTTLNLFSASGNWGRMIECINKIISLEHLTAKNPYLLELFKCYLRTNRITDAKHHLELLQLSNGDKDLIFNLIQKAEKNGYFIDDDFDITLTKKFIDDFDETISKSDILSAENILQSYSSSLSDFYIFKDRTAVMQFYKGNYSEAEKIFLSIYPDIYDAPIESIEYYFKTLNKTKQDAEIVSIFEESHLTNKRLSNATKNIICNCYINLDRFIEAEEFLTEDEHSKILKSTIQRHTNKITDAYSTIKSIKSLNLISEYELAIELAQLNNDWESAIRYLKDLIIKFPKYAETNIWLSYQNMTIINNLTINK